MILMFEDSVFTTGKYKGKTVAEVAATDKRYIIDYQTRTRSNFISDEVMDNLDKYRLNTTRSFNQEPSQPRLGGFEGTT